MIANQEAFLKAQERLIASQKALIARHRELLDATDRAPKAQGRVRPNSRSSAQTADPETPA